MPALNGQVISIIPDSQGQPAIVATWFYDPVTFALRAGTYQTSTGSKTGAFISDNLLGRQVRVLVTNESTGQQKSIAVPTGGTALSVAQMSGAGFTTLQNVNGLTFDLS